MRPLVLAAGERSAESSRPTCCFSSASASKRSDGMPERVESSQPAGRHGLSRCRELLAQTLESGYHSERGLHRDRDERRQSEAPLQPW